MLISLLQAFEGFLIALWIGAIWFIGYVAIPLLFNFLPDKQLAGELAGHFLQAVSITSMVIAPILLVLAVLLKKSRSHYVFAIVCMALISMVSLFFVNPILVALKASVAPLSVQESLNAEKFRYWHAVSSSLYLFQSLLGLLFFWRKTNYL